MAYPLDLSGAPHYDTGSAEIDRGYILVLPRPGKKIQGREFVAAQRFLEKAIKDVGNMIAKDGTIVSGCELVVNIPSPFLETDQVTITVGAGKVWINGRVWDVPATDTDIAIGAIGIEPANIGTSTVDVILTETVITESEDSTLRSPAENHSNFSQPGAYRLKAEAAFAVNTGTGVTIYKLVNGAPLRLPTTGAFSELEPILARRTFDESDNYRVTGLTLISEGDDSTSFANQEYLVPSDQETFPTGAITPGEESHPYGPDWTNRFTSDGGSPDFTHDQIGKKLVILSGDFAGEYTILDVVTTNEIEVDAQFDGSPATDIQFGIKDFPQKLKITVNAGKAYVQGFEVLKPISTQLTLNKPLSGNEILNEPQAIAFRSYNYPFREQPFLALASEGITANLLIGLGMPAEMSGTARAETGPTRNQAQVDVNYNVSYDDLYAITGLPIVEVYKVASAASTWTWILDPQDPDYPGVFTGGVEYSEAASLGASGWWQEGNRLYWGAPNRPSNGAQYKVVCTISTSLERGTDFRIKNTASAIMYSVYGEAGPLPVTFNALAFPQQTYDLSGGDDQFVFDVDGTRIAVNFSDAPNLAIIGSLATASIVNVVNVINKVAFDAGLPNVATVQFETQYSASPVRGFIVLKSPTTGTSSTIEIIQGNQPLGFPTGAPKVTGSNFPVDVIAMGGHRAISRMVPSSSMSVDYSFALYRKDLITIDRDGNILALEGEPDIQSKINAREGFMSTLSLGSIELTPGTFSTKISQYDNLRTTMPELRKLINRVDNIEYNLAVLDLDREAIGNENPSNLSGVFSDGFVGLSKAEIDYSSATDIDVESGDPVEVIYDAAIDIVDKEVSLSFTETDNALTVNENGTTQTISLDGDSIIVLPFVGDGGIIEQESVTEFISLNPYGTYTTSHAKIRLTPYYENYMLNDNDFRPILQEQIIPHRFINSWVKPRVTLDKTEDQTSRFNLKNATSASLNDRTSAQAVTIETSDKIIEDTVPYIRPKQITMHGRGFLPNESGIYVTFDGTEIAFDSVTTNFGTLSSGKVTANAKGQFKAKFTLPTVQRRPAHTVVAHGSTNTATTNYRGWFWKRNPPEDVYHSEKKGFIPRLPVVENVHMGLAQTFQVSSDAVIRALSVYFEKLDENYPIVVQIRNVENNLPGKICYAEEVLSTITGTVGDPPELISTDKSPTGNVPFKLFFKEPVFVRANQDYAICIGSKGNDYTLGIARVGQVDLNSGQIVSQQPFNVGKLYTNPSASEWIPQDDADLSFILHQAVFLENTEATVYFNKIDKAPTTANYFTRLLLAAESTEMTGTYIKWFFSVDNGSSYAPIVPFAVTEIGTNPNTLYSNVTIKAVLFSNDKYSTPFLLKDSISVMTRRLITSGEYVTKRTEFSEGNDYNEVRQTIKVKQGTGGTVDVYFGFQDSDGNTNWVTAVEDPDQAIVSLSDGFSRIYYKTPVPNLPAPDMTSPAKIVGTITPSIITPTFNTVADDNFTMSITYWNGAATTVTPTVTFGTPSTTQSAASVVSEINSQISAAITDAVPAITFNIASLDELNHVVLTHPQSGGPLRNKLQITSSNTALGLGVQTKYGGSVVGTAVAGGALTAATYYYAFVGTDGLGYTEFLTANQQDTVKVITSGGNLTARLTFNSFGKTSVNPATSTVIIYRGTGTPGSLTFKKVAELSLQDLEDANYIYDDALAPSGPDVTIPESEVAALQKLSDFRGRLHLATSANGNAPIVREFTNVFVRA